MEITSIGPEDTAEELLLAACYRIARERARIVKQKSGNGDTQSTKLLQVAGENLIEHHEMDKVAAGSEDAGK